MSWHVKPSLQVNQKKASAALAVEWVKKPAAKKQLVKCVKQILFIINVNKGVCYEGR